MYAQSLIGTLLLGRYRVEEVLGVGGMGVVVRAVHLDLDTQVAIKFLLPHMAESSNVVQRFLREAQAAVRLKGEHVAKVIDVGKMPDGAPFMVMEYLSGADLGQVLKAHGAQPPNVACDLMMQICEGMAEAHANGIVHRDVKPSNFFVTRGPDGSPLVKILDFGISKVPIGNDMQQLTGTQSMVGTPAYMAPEHMRAANRADQRSDLWSMGVVLYQLLTNQLPFDGESYADLCLKVAMDLPAPILVPLPPGLGEVLLRCLEKEAAQRYQSVAQLAYALAPYCTDPMVAGTTAERCGRILEAPRGPRAPTLGEKESLGSPSSIALISPYGPGGPGSQAGNHRSHGSHLRSHLSSLSSGAGEVGRKGGSGSRTALYGLAAALVLVVGVGLGVFAASGNGKGAEPAESERATQSEASAEPATSLEPTPATVPVEPTATADVGAAEPAAVPATPAEPVQPALQGGAEPTPPELPLTPPTTATEATKVAAEDSKVDAKTEGAKADDAKPDEKADAKADDAKTAAKLDDAKAARAKAAKAAAAKAAAAKKKKKSDLFQSRE